MAKYRVLKPLSPKQGRMIEPGERIELDDAVALALLNKDAITPAETRRARKAAPPKPEQQELDNGTDN